MFATMLTLASDELERMGLIGGLTLGAMFIVFMGLAVFWEERRKVISHRETEETKREIAAYVAEGTMSADDAERILTSGKTLKDRIRDVVG